MKTETMADWKSNREEKIDAARSLLAEAVGRLQTGDEWKAMLAGLARGGRYSIQRLSFRNQLLIAMQRGGTTDVATYGAWQHAGRQVRRGEKAITILAPVIVARSAAKETDETESVLVGFRPHAVFAASQTDPLPGGRGRPLPEPVAITKDVTAPECFENSVEVLRAVALGLGSDVVAEISLRPRRSDDPGEAHGWYERRTRSIVVVNGETSRAQQFKTLTHEIAHAILHGQGDHHARDEMEIEAESVAFVVSHVLALDTSAYSFAYVATWAGTKDAQKMVLASGQRIVRAVNVILDALLGAREADQAEAA